MPDSNKMRPTSLMLAAYREDADLIRVLLASAEDVNVCDAEGQTALDYHDQSYPYHDEWANITCGQYQDFEAEEVMESIESKHQQIAQMFLEAGAIRGKKQKNAAE